MLSLQEIRKRKANPILVETKRQKLNTDLSKVKIKTLSEIRAEKFLRLTEKRKPDEEEISSTSEVTSTSNNDDAKINKVSVKISPIKRLKRNQIECKPKLIRREEMQVDEEQDKDIESDDVTIDQSKEIIPQVSEDETFCKNSDNLTESKLDDLLLEDEELEGDVTMKAEEDLLKDIDELLNE